MFLTKETMHVNLLKVIQYSVITILITPYNIIIPAYFVSLTTLYIAPLNISYSLLFFVHIVCDLL